MSLCALCKQPQIVFVLLELMICRPKESRRWGSLAIVVLPGLILSPLWVVAVSADIAVWRLIEERNDSSEQFDPLWKLLYMWDHPYHFPLAAWSALSGWAGRLWQELIGIVGWQDILLPPWTYLVLTVLLLLVPLQIRKRPVSTSMLTRILVPNPKNAFQSPAVHTTPGALSRMRSPSSSAPIDQRLDSNGSARVRAPPGCKGEAGHPDLETAEVHDDPRLETSGFMAEAQNVKPKPA